MAELASIDINFDSLRWAFSADPLEFRDPTFFEIADRFFELSQQYRFRYTIFVIGEDIENPRVAERMREWAAAGHEIGNHSYAHHQNLGALPDSEIERDVMKTHELIARHTGREPRGFASPAWSASPALLRILEKRGYLYDTSLHPSWMMMAASAKVWWNFRKDGRRSAVLQRRDRLANLIGHREPFFFDGRSLTRAATDGLLEMPLPVTRLCRLPCWHTMGFLLPPSLFSWVLRSSLERRYFYYLVHPTDLLDRSDFPPRYRDNRVLERVDIPLEDKRAALTSALDLIARRSERIVTLEEMASAIISEAGNRAG